MPCIHPKRRTLYVRGHKSEGSPFVAWGSFCEKCGHVAQVIKEAEK